MHQFNIPQEEKYFLLPASPTPNGRMHLGHIAGPYLKMDAVRRKVQRGNGTAWLVSGSDVYESHVELKAAQLGLSANEVANTFHDLILKDFNALDIEFNLFINPLHRDHVDSFSARQKELMQDLIDSGKVVEREEVLIYDPLTKRYLAGCWIQGDCPNCKVATSSYLCENCGMHYRPIDIFKKHKYPQAELIKSCALYLKLDDEKLQESLEKVNNGLFMKTMQEYLALQGPYIRLTTAQETGVEWSLNSNVKQVIFTYLANLMAYIYFADVCKEKFHLAEHPLSKASSYISVVSFGVDTVIPFTIGLMAVGQALSDYKSFDGYISNSLYNLNGKKFSTSRENVIWGNDIVSKANVQSDAVRYYLMKHGPEANGMDFVVDDFIECVNTVLFKEHNTVIDKALSRASTISNPIDEYLINELEKHLVSQNACFELPVFNCSESVRPIEIWVKQFRAWNEEQQTQYAYWWLKGYALLAYPIMPNIARSIWAISSSQTHISLDHFFQDSALQEETKSIEYFKAINNVSMEECIPRNSNPQTNREKN